MKMMNENELEQVAAGFDFGELIDKVMFVADAAGTLYELYFGTD